MQVQREIITACQRQSFVYKVEDDVWPVYHFHPEIDILYFKKDRGRVILGDYIGDFEPGDIFFLSPSIPHALHASERKIIKEDDSLYVIQFSLDSLGQDFLAKYEMEGINNFLNSCNKAYKLQGTLRERIASKMEEMNKCSTTSQFSHLLQLLEMLSESSEKEFHPITSPSYNPSMKVDSVNKVNSVINFIIKNKHRHISLDEISDHLCMTSKSFCRFFKKNTGKNFVNYVNEIKIGEACKLLISSDLTVSEICSKSGFNNISNFNRRFLELKGMPPKEFRIQAKL